MISRLVGNNISRLVGNNISESKLSVQTYIFTSTKMSHSTKFRKMGHFC